MKIFIDTNIFLTLLLKREGFKYARRILNACATGIWEGVVCDITLLNIDYVASKQTKNVRYFLKIINDNFLVVGIDNAMFQEALKIENSDLEDSVQYICAQKAHCDVIVTDDRNFFRGEIAVLDSQAFVRQYF